MNPLRSLAAVLLSLLLLAASLRAAGTIPTVVEAVFATATTVPITAVSYTATGNTVNLGLNFAPPAGTNLTVVNNTGLAFIQGTFDNLEQGQTVSMTFGGVVYPFVANYYGGTGNDLVLLWLNTRTMGWGYNFYGTLDTTRVNRLVPAPVIAGGVLAGRRVTSFSTASEHSLALVADGTVAAWGNNYFGPVGDGTNIDRMAPVSLAQAGVLAGRRMIAVKARGSVSLALGADGRVAAWGYNDNGALGNNVPGNAKTPTAVYTGGALAGKTVVAVTTGGQHCLALCSDGALLAWGLNSYGQLGDGTQVARMEPVSVNQSGVLAGKVVVAVAAGFYHSMVLCSDGTLATWGGQTDGQLGNGGTTRSAIPVRVTTTGVLAGKTVAGMSAVEYHNVVVCTDGTVATWGRNYEGQLGNAGTSSSNVPVLVNRSGVLAGKIVTAVAAGATHSMALCTDGTVVTWGDNANGQLGINSTTKSNVPVPVNCGLLSGERVVAVMAGSGSCFATVASPPPPIGATAPATEVVDAGATLHGSVSANGSSTSVAFEYGLTTACENTVTAVPASLTGTAEHPVSVALNGLRAGTTYYYRVAATSSGGTVRGETLTFATTTLASLDGLALNGGTLAPAFARTQTRYSVTVPNATAQVMVTPVASDAAATIQVNGATVPSGTASEPIPLEVGNQELAVVIAAAGGGNTQTYTVTVTRLPAEFAFDSATSVPVTAERVALAGNSAVFALRYAPAVGTRLTVVNNTGTEPIQGTFSNLSQGQTVTVVHGGIRYGFVANYFGGDGNDLVLLWANTRLLAWGANSYGVVGDGSDTPRPLPVPVGATGVLAGKTILSIAAHYQCFAVAADGTLAAWGKNDYGQLGDGTLTNRSVPVAVVRSGALVGMTVVAVSTGQAHSLALGADGTMAAWGLNGYGQLGDGTSIWGGVLTPVAVNQAGVLAGRRVVAIAAGGVHNLALCADGALVAWGNNSYGQCGDGSISGRPLPVLVDRSGVLAGKTIRMIAAGDEYSLAVCSDGTVAAWGRNNLGQLGDQTTMTRYAPVAVNRSGILAGRTVVAVSAASSHSLAACADGVIAAWGNNTAGQLGNGGTTTSLVPVQTIPSGVLAGKRMIGVNGGYSHSIALGEDGSLAAWGDNTYAQLGYGGTASSSVPVLVNTAALRAGERVVTGVAGDSSNLVLAASPPPPLAVTTSATDVVDAGALLHGTVNGNGSSAVVSFEYGVSTAYGATVAGVPATVSGTTTEAVSAAVNELVPGTTYHYRVIASGGGGKVTGEDLTFTTTTLASLDGMALTGGQLLPAFTRGNRQYAATVPFDTTAVTITPVATDAMATVRVNGGEVPSGTASAPVQLVVGNNPIDVTVAAAGDGNTQTYQVTVTRLPAVFFFSTAATVPVSADAFSVTGFTAELALGFVPAVGTKLTILGNTGTGPIKGAFANLAHGQVVPLSFGGANYPFVVNYRGGDGNDLTLEWASKRLLAWGSNASGQLGDGTIINRLIPTAVTGGALAGKVVMAVAAGDSHNLALGADGTFAAWGSNSYGMVGDGTTINRYPPTLVNRAGVLAGRSVIAMAAGENHSLALGADGTLATWGNNAAGQLGNGQFLDGANRLPLRVDAGGVLAGKAVKAIASGTSHNLVLCDDGTLIAWGYNSFGNLGDNTTTNRSLPVLVDQTGVLAGKKVTAIAVGVSSNLALCADGTLAAWGANSFGALGDGTTTTRRVPVLVDRSGVLAGRSIASIAMGAGHCLALCTDGSLATWGFNYYGQLGNGQSSFSGALTPILVNPTGALTGRTVSAIACGYNSSFALCTDGTLVGWGRNSAGQLGDNATIDRTSPVAVATTNLRVGERFVGVVSGGSHTLGVTVMPPPPTLETLTASSVGSSAATLNGTVNAAGGSVSVAFEYGTSTAYGTTVAATPGIVNGVITAAVGKSITGLIAGAIYHYRVVATYAGGTTYGTDMTFTVGNPPVFGGYAIATPWQTAAVIPLRKLLTKASDPDGDTFTVTAAGPASANGGTVALLADSIRYLPPNNFSGTDTFPVTVTDAGGTSVAGTVTVTVGPAPNAGGTGVNPPTLTTLPDGKMAIAFHGIPGRAYVVQRSVSGLDNWVTLATIPADASGKVAYTDEAPPAGSAFYRLGLP